MEGRAHCDDRRVAALRRLELQELGAVELRHHEVEHDDIGGELAAALEAFAPVLRGGDDVPGLDERGGDHLADRPVVLDDQDLLHRC